MQLFYNSDQFAVMAFEIPSAGEWRAAATQAVPIGFAGSADASADAGPEASETPPAQAPLRRGGFEIVDKRLRREIFIEGALAEHFHQGVQALAEGDPDEEALDDFISGFTVLAQQPLHMH